MNNNELFEGGYAKKAYLPIGKQFVCGKERVIYKKNTNTDSSKVYMRHNAKYIQVKNFEKEMIAKGKWKLPTPIKQSNKKPNVKPCKADQYRNPATGRCVKIKPDKVVKPDVKPQNKTISKTVIGMLMNKNITFTGIRDKNLEAVIESNGGKVFSTVSSKVDLLIAKDINANSASIIKAKQLNIDIIQYDKLMNL